MRPTVLFKYIIGTFFVFAITVTFSHPGIDRQVKGLLKGISIKDPLDGQATWYGQQSMGSCGWWSKNSDFVVALSNQLPYNKHCGKNIIINYKGRTIKAKISDTCMSCDAKHVDLSRGAFAKLTDGNFDLGLLPIKWHFE